MIDNGMNRLNVKRGSQLPHAKLNESDVQQILCLVEYREKLKQEAKTLTNQRIAEKFGVHLRTIDRITAGESWGHVV